MIRRMLPVLVLACLIAPTCNPAIAAAQAAVTSVPAQAPALKITPSSAFVGGQALQWTGNLGVSGQRIITMEKNLGRVGEAWEPVLYFSDVADAAGSFAFSYPAPAMRGVQYRVVSGTYRTPGIALDAVQPDLVLWVSGADRDNPAIVGKAVAGEAFGISVDTTPDLFRRPDTEGLLPISGRTLTLERRVAGTGDKWVPLNTTTADRAGMGYFTGVRESQPGQVVYRVREENWFKGKHAIGWFPSFPTYVTVSAKGVVEPAPALDVPVGPALPEATAADETVPDGSELASPDAVGGTASQKYGWPASYFDFAWVSGESLTSPPYRGTRKKGWWLDYSDGGGRVSKDGGGLILDSKRVNEAGSGDFGTTKGTLQNNPITFGRWEVKLSPTSSENVAEDYKLRLELVPDKAQDDGCRTITVAELTDHGRTMYFGVNASDTQWSGSYDIGAIDHTTHAFAIEVTDDHITWFVDAKPIGTVKDKLAISGVKMTLRISMVGNGDREMNRTELKSDWQRGFSLEKGEQVTSGAPLTKKALGSC